MSYDDVIVGAGSCGAILAARLSENPDRRVLSLEAGPDYPSLAETPADLVSGWMSLVDHDWGTTALAVADRSIFYPRGKVVGGSSAVNGTIALRGHPADFEEWAARGLPEWSWPEVLSVYRRLEDDPVGTSLDPDAHAVGGAVPIDRVPRASWQPVHATFHAACLAAGLGDCVDFNAPGASGAGVWPRNTRDGVRMSSALTHLAPARARPNLEIRANTLVDKVVVEAGRAVAVDIIGSAGRERVAGTRISLAAGAVGSPPILLRSGIGPAAALQALGIPVVVDRPGVGARLLDHPAVGIPAVAADGVPHDTSVVTQAGLRYTAPGSFDCDDIQVVAATLFDPAFTRSLLGQEMRLFAIGSALVRPRSTGRLTITTPDPAAQPVVELNYLADAADVARLIDALRLTRDLCRSPQLVDVIGPPLIDDAVLDDDAAVTAMLRAQVTTTYHPAGTAPMGPANDDNAVVDGHGRVHGVEGLRVADASIMPTSVRCNTNLTCLMLAERIAPWIVAETDESQVADPER
jgi:choline dehydrogenase-like flavoprotein